ncbi:hypothetical protein MP638_003745 [Amoeboaphelidium occidentale]|nr:hypothetical protein MP638_003745 [Amoeboaphelidium occidentale]
MFGFGRYDTQPNCGCFSALPEEPKGHNSEYFEDISGSLAVHVKTEELKTRFSWLVKLRKALPQNAYVEAEFPDIEDKSQPYKTPVSKLIGNPENEERYFAVSQEVPVRCGIYNVKMVVYEDATRQKVISIHRSEILSRIDSSNCQMEQFRAMLSKINKE